MTKRTVELSQELINTCASLVYNRWAEEFDNLKRVKTERCDGSIDWQEFHTTRLENHTELEAFWKDQLEEIKVLASWD